MTQHSCTFTVRGTPAPKGSSRAFFKAGMKRAVVVKDNSERQKGWEQAVRDAIAVDLFDGAMPEVPLFVDTAIAVTITFHMARPAGHWGKGKNAGRLLPSAPPRPRVKPDIDKLARSTLDAMTGSILDDDSRIADLTLAKRWAEPGQEGATISVRAATEAA